MPEAKRGLTSTWIEVAFALLSIYIIYSFIMPVSAFIDNITGHLLVEFGVAGQWLSVYNQWLPILRNWFGYLAIGLMVALIIWVVVQPSKRTIDEL